MPVLPATNSRQLGRRSMTPGGRRSFVCCRSRTVSLLRDAMCGYRVRNGIDADALVIGAGPAGASTAILLQSAGWRVILVEQHAYPRQKVCGECLSAASLALLDRLGVGAAVRDRAGPELQQI